jgi:uncharacterized membrane protein YkvA (DUF1232 family)
MSAQLNRILRVTKKAGHKMAEVALTLFYCAMDPSTPFRVKAVIFGDLAYLISPVDAIPDVLPGGFVDDYGILIATLALLSAHIKDEHRAKAKKKTVELFGKAA